MTKKNKGQRNGFTKKIIPLSEALYHSPSYTPSQNTKSPGSGQRKAGWEHGAFKRRKAVMMTTFLKKTLASAYFPTQKYAVSWAMKSLTAEFGMGSGIPSSLWTPRKYENV